MNFELQMNRGPGASIWENFSSVYFKRNTVYRTRTITRTIRSNLEDGNIELSRYKWVIQFCRRALTFLIGTFNCDFHSFRIQKSCLSGYLSKQNDQNGWMSCESDCISSRATMKLICFKLIQSDNNSKNKFVFVSQLSFIKIMNWVKTAVKSSYLWNKSFFIISSYD